MLMNAYNNSLMVVTAWNCNQLVGVLRIVGDGYSIIYVQDIIVLKEYQRNGVGTRLFQFSMKRFENVYQKVLLTDKQEKTESFYRKMGFTPSEEYNCISFVQFRHS
jgi:GNAT superfamily N-acetyltransferase